MINLDETLNKFKEDMQSATDWADELYSNRFAEYFKTQSELAAKLRNNSKSITDDELEVALTCIPLDLFTCAEHLNELRMYADILKLKISDMESETESNLKAAGMKDATAIKRTVLDATIAERILQIVISNLISRVESQCSASKELVMSAKKIWDRRKDADNAAGVHSAGTAEPSSSLPEYDRSNKGKTYVG